MTARCEKIEIHGGDGSFAAYCAIPEHPKPVAVLVLQEIFGVNANIRDIVDMFADAGYPAIAPDLYWRQAPGIELNPGSEQDRARAMELMKGLDRASGVADGAAALAALRQRAPGLTRSAAIGYCFGGGVAYLMAARNMVDTGIAYYGTYLHMMLDEAAGLEGRLLLHIAGEDHLCPPEAQQKIADALAPLGARAEIIVHPGAGHAFARRGGASFDQPAADRANERTMAALASLADMA